jgi:cobalt-zinc-cadmium efflux system protein
MLGSPPDIDGNDVVSAIQSVDGVLDVHHVHLWQMQEHTAALDCHIVVERHQVYEADKIKENVKSVLLERFSIEHSTLEFEASDNAHHEAQVFGHRS